MGLIILKEDKKYRVQFEKIAGEYWVEFIEKATGLSQVLYVKNKKKALSMYKNMEIKQIKEFVDRIGLKKIKFYKEGVL